MVNHSHFQIVRSNGEIGIYSVYIYIYTVYVCVHISSHSVQPSHF